jgi:large subunit ribosomal protein L29
MRNSFKDLTYNEFITKREDLKNEYRDFRFDMVIRHVENPLKKRTLRRTLARVNTVIHEYDIGIRKK